MKSRNNPKIRYHEMIPLAILYLIAFSAFFTGISWTSVMICIGLFFLRAFAIGGGYHRYFSHKTYKTSRVFQFILAFLAQSSFEKGVLWWANHHRLHHKYSDTINDVHSPRQHGFWFSHMGWIFTDRFLSKDYQMVNDLEKFPELRFLDKWHWIPGLTLATIVFLCAGYQGFVVGFVISTLLVHHLTYSINSLCHKFGSQRYITGDDSRNTWWLALFSMGESWHNNHHYYPNSVRQGFFWWEFDLTYYILKLLAVFGIVWDLRCPTAKVINDRQYVSNKANTLVQGLIRDNLDCQPILNYCQQLVDKTKVGLVRSQYVAALHGLIQMFERLKRQTKQLPPLLAEKQKQYFNQMISKAQELIHQHEGCSVHDCEECQSFLSDIKQKITGLLSNSAMVAENN